MTEITNMSGMTDSTVDTSKNISLDTKLENSAHITEHAAAYLAKQTLEDASSKKTRSRAASKELNIEPLSEVLEAPKTEELNPNSIKERRIESYRILKQWEADFFKLTNDHRLICEGISHRIATRAELSLDGFDSMIAFFSERLNQEELIKSIIERPMPKVLHHDKKEKVQIDSHCFWTMSQYFEDFDQYHEVGKDNDHEKMRLLLREILNKELGELQKEFNHKVSNCKDNMSKLRKKTVELSQEVQAKLQKYNEFWINVETHKEDVYVRELAILENADREVQSLRSFGAQVCSSWIEIHKFELQRYHALKDCMLAYLKKMIEIKADKKGQASDLIKKLEQFSPEEEVKRLYGVSAVLMPNEIDSVKGFMGMNSSIELTMAHLEAYMSALNPPRPDKTPLIIREWGALWQFGLFHSWKPVHLVVTIDENLVILDKMNPDAEKAEHIVSLKDMSGIAFSRPDVMDLLKMEMFSTKPGFFLDSVDKYTFKFHTEEQPTDFMNFLKMKGESQ